MHHAAQVFANDVKLNIYNTTYLESVKIGMLISIRYNGYLKGVIRWVTNRQADSIDCY